MRNSFREVLKQGGIEKQEGGKLKGLTNKVGVTVMSILAAYGFTASDVLAEGKDVNLSLQDESKEGDILDSNQLFSQQKLQEIESGLKAQGKSLSYELGNGEMFAETSVTPSDDSIEGEMEVGNSGTWEGDITVLHDINNIENDTRLELSYKVLYAGAQLGTYIGVKKGGELEQYLLSQGFKVKGGMVKLSGSVLKKLVEVNFGEVNAEEQEEMTQKSAGIEYTMDFNGLLNELKTGVTYYDVDGEKLGTVGNIVDDTSEEYDWTRVKGGIRGGQSLAGQVESVLKLTEDIKLGLRGGYERTEYEDMYDEDSETERGATYGGDITYQPNKHNRVTLSGDHREGEDVYSAKYERNLGGGLRGYVKGERRDNRDGIEDENSGEIGISYTFGGGEESGYSPLFPDNAEEKEELNLSDIYPMKQVESENIRVKEKVIYKEHMVNIDKSALGEDGSIEKNEDGTLEKVNIDTGVDNLKNGNIESLNYSSYKDHFTIEENSLLVVDDFEELKSPATYKIEVEQQDGSFTIIELEVGGGSVDLGAAPKTASDVPGDLANDFVEGKKSFDEVKEEASNEAPKDKTVSESVDEDNTLSGSVSTTDPDGDSLSYSKKSGPSHGSLNVSSDGSYTYTPDANYSGSDSFEIEAADGNGGTGTITVEVNVNNVNDAPESKTISESVDEDGILNGSVSTNDPDGDSLTYSKKTGPSNGSLTVNSDGSYTYTPDANYNGSDSFEIEANDGNGNTGTITVEVTVNSVNDAPTLDLTGWSSEYYTITKESETDSKVIFESNNSSGTEYDRFDFSFSDVEGLQEVTYKNGAGSTIKTDSLSGTSDTSYIDVPGASDGSTRTVIAEVKDSNGEVTQYKTIEINYQMNGAPQDKTVSESVDEDNTLSSSVSTDDPDGDSLTYSKKSGPNNGILSVASDGSYTYEPNANFNGSDSFEIEAADGNGGTGTITVEVTVNSINDAPTAQDVSIDAGWVDIVTYDMSGDINDVENSDSQLQIIVVDGPDHATLSWNGNEFTYDTNDGYISGNPDSFTYKVKDSQGAESDVKTVTLNEIVDS